jgi:hypothetical protein
MDTTTKEKPKAAQSLRDSIRESVLNSEAESEIVHAFGHDIEIKYPSLQDLLAYRNADQDDSIMGRAIVNNCYVPGTDQRVFEVADVDVLMTKKFTPDMRKLNAAINRILGGDEALQKEVEDNTKSPST